MKQNPSSVEAWGNTGVPSPCQDRMRSVFLAARLSEDPIEKVIAQGDRDDHQRREYPEPKSPQLDGQIGRIVQWGWRWRRGSRVAARIGIRFRRR